ncbi:MAG: hypothetical protein Q9176_003257 [Flavoplaca citrina]
MARSCPKACTLRGWHWASSVRPSSVLAKAKIAVITGVLWPAACFFGLRGDVLTRMRFRKVCKRPLSLVPKAIIDCANYVWSQKAALMTLTFTRMREVAYRMLEKKPRTAFKPPFQGAQSITGYEDARPSFYRQRRFDLHIALRSIRERC